MRVVSTFGVCKPKAAFNCADFTEGMAPVSAAEKAALDAFFKGKRGERKLIEHPPMRGRNWTNAERWWLGGRGQATCVLSRPGETCRESGV